MRYNKTEQLGVIATNQIITEELGWIFREQPFIDVGIDAIIEQTIAGEPTGKLAALQIKSGKGNVYETKNSLTYYASNIHRNYWLKLNIPILIVIYIPEDKKCYWEVISKKTLIPTKKAWKINIHKTKVFHKKSEVEISQILRVFSGRDDLSYIYSFNNKEDIIEAYELMFNATESINKLNTLIDDIGVKSKKFMRANRLLDAKGLYPQDKIYLTKLKQQSTSYILTSKRIISEIKMLAEVLPDEFLILEEQCYFYLEKVKDTTPLLDSIKDMPVIAKTSLENFISFRETVEKFPKWNANLKEARTSLTDAIDCVTLEYESIIELSSILNKRIIKAQTS